MRKNKPNIIPITPPILINVKYAFDGVVLAFHDSVIRHIIYGFITVITAIRKINRIKRNTMAPKNIPIIIYPLFYVII